eukprot:COSAG01_NODE_10405_length_2174_cov_193.931084_3_plen_69_part_00
MFKQKMSRQQNEEFGPGTFAAGRDFTWSGQDTSDFRAWYEQAKQYKEDFFLSEDTLDFRDLGWLEQQL